MASRRRRRNRRASNSNRASTTTITTTTTTTTTEAGARKDRKDKDPKTSKNKRAGLGRGFWLYMVAMMAVLLPLNLVCLNQANPPGPGNTAEVQSEVLLDSVEASHVGYSTDPPTSGPRVTELASPGHRIDTLRDEIQVANLHSGYVIVHYNSTAPSIISSEMRQLAAEFEGWPVIVQPDKTLSNTTAVALTAWGQIEQLDEYDKGRIYRFIRHYAGLDQSNQSQNARTGD